MAVERALKTAGAAQALPADAVRFVDLKEQCASIMEEVDAEVREVFAGCDFILGEKVKAFEREFAAYCGVRHALGVASGTDALHLSLRALGIGEGDEVITQANTFVATALAISYTGAAVVLSDVEPASFNIDPREVEAALTPRTRAIVPVHLYGSPAPMDELREIARSRNLFIVEDACQAHGASYCGSGAPKRAGSLGDIAAFSFYPGKNLGAYGDGGAVTTDNVELAESVRMLRDYGQRQKYTHLVRGYNSRLDTIQAAVLRVKLRRLDEWNALRASHALRYEELLSGVPEIRLPLHDPSKGLCHVFHLYVVRARNRAALAQHLKERGIGFGIHYPVPVHLQPAFGGLGYGRGDFPVTESLADEVLSLPMYPELKGHEIERVSEAVREFYGRR